MHHSYMFGARAWHSVSFDYSSHCQNERQHAFFRPSRDCSCCCNSLRRVSTRPNYCYSVCGMRQSSLIHWPPCRKMVFGSFDPCFLARVSAFDVGSSRSCCCDEVRCFSEKSGSRRKERLRKFVVLEERSKRYSDEFIDEAEAVLSLLTDEVDDEYLRVSAKARRAAKKNIQNEIRNTKVSSTVRSKKMMGSYLDILEDESASSHDSDSLHSSEIESNMGKEKVCKNRGRHALLPEENRRAILKKRNNRTLLTSGIIASQKEEKDVPLRKLSRKSEEQHAEEKKSLMENLKVEDVSKKLKNDESSCSSYHSFASSGNYESDNEVEHRQEEYVKQSTGHERNSSGEIVKKQVMHEDHRVGEHGISMKKSSSSVVSNFIESDFRKKSEKKLTEASVEEMESMKRNSRKESKFLEHKHYEKSSDCNVDYDDQKKKSSLDMKLDEETKQQHYKQASDEGSMESETRLKYKNHMDGQGIHYGDPKISYGSKESMYRVKSDAFPKIATSNLETGGKSQSVVGITTRNELNQSSSSTQVAKASKSDVKKTSISLQSSETAISGDNYTISLPSKNDDEKLQPRFEQVHGTEVPGGVSQQVIRIENNSVVKQSNQIIKQEENVSLSYGSTVESEKKPHSGRAHDKISEPVDHSFGSDEAKRISITLSGAVDVHHTVDKNVKETEASSVDVLNEGQWRFPQNVVSHASGDSQTKEHDSKGDDWFSRAAEGPSDEMWKLYEPSTTDSRQQKEVIRDDETEAGTEFVKGHDDETRAGAEIVKRNGRSLWNIIGDIFRLRWSPRSGSHHSGRKTGGSPQTQSTGSEPWFSSHEAEENEEASRNGRSTVKKTSPHGHRKERSVFQVEEKSSSSASEKLEGGLQATTISPAITATTSSSGEETSGVTPSVAAIDSSTTSPVLRPQEPLFVSMDHRSESTVSQGKSKGRMLQRKDQLQRGDRFAEWEEAYRLEAEQRKIDETFMREAISEAQKAGDNWEVPVGAVLVHDGKIIARGCNQVEELRDSTAHAEMICIREASNVLRTWRLSETVLYVTLEPCPMCAGAILQARIDTVVWGAPNKLLGADGSWIRLFPNGDGTEPPPPPVHPFHPNISIRRGVLASECADAMQQFFKLRRKKKDVKKKPEEEPPHTSSCLPVVAVQTRPPKFLSRMMHHAFTMMMFR